MIWQPHEPTMLEWNQDDPLLLPTAGQLRRGCQPGPRGVPAAPTRQLGDEKGNSFVAKLISKGEKDKSYTWAQGYAPSHEPCASYLCTEEGVAVVVEGLRGVRASGVACACRESGRKDRRTTPTTHDWQLRIKRMVGNPGAIQSQRKPLSSSLDVFQNPAPGATTAYRRVARPSNSGDQDD